MLINKATLPLAWALRQVGKRVRLRGWERLLRALFHPDRQRHFAFRIPFNGFTYPAYADHFIDWNALFYGSYEKFELRLLAALAARIEGAVFLDVGTNVGHHALYMTAYAEQVHAFEPNPAMWPLIEEKLSINGVENLFLHRCGLGAAAGTLPLYLGHESSRSTLVLGTNGIYSSLNVPVTIVRGDDFFHEADFDKFHLVKLDVEGFEKYAIDGMRTQLAVCRPILMIEISESGKEQFGDYTMFAKTFPADYGFYFGHLISGVTIRTVLRPADETVYGRFSGNIFCVPREKRELFLEVADMS